MATDEVTGGRAWSTEDERDLAELTAGLARIQQRHDSVLVQMTAVQVSQLVGALQLAIRHPNFPELVKRSLRGFMEGLLNHIGAEEPEVERILRRGFDPADDRLYVEPWAELDFDDIDTAWGRFELAEEGGEKG